MRARSAGFVYPMLLVALAVLAAGAATFVLRYSAVVRAEREAELLRAGAAVVRAIGAYYENSPGTVRQYPRRLQDLIEDPRVVSMRRHLRRIPIDPTTGQAQWGLVAAPDGGVMGIHSLSAAAPRKQAGFPAWVDARQAPQHYSDLRFIYVPKNDR